MNYSEELRERYNEVMFDERDIIEKFLKDQYDIRYGRQRDTWHFEPAVRLIGIYGCEIAVTDAHLDKNKFVTFTGICCNERNDDYECTDFAYGELSKVIEALPNAEDIVWDNAVNDLKVMTTNLRIDYLLNEHPFKYEVGSKHYVVDDVKCVNGTLSLVQALGNDTPVSDLPLEVLVELRDHINIGWLHKYNEYKELVKFLSEQPNLCFEPENWGDVEFTIHGTDMKVDVLSASLDSNNKLQLCVDDDNKETIYLEEKDIRPEYLADLVGYIEDHCSCDIMDIYNGHNAELVRKINSAWKSGKYNQEFGYIIYSIANRDYNECKEKFDCDMDNFLSSIIDDCNKDSIHNVLENVCDDQDLETILSFIRYEE